MSRIKLSQLVSLEVAAIAARSQAHLSPFRIARAIYDLDAVGRQLHKRYEAMCSYAWADTYAYRGHTDRLEIKAQAIAAEAGLDLELQRDPRGWPLIIRIDGIDYRLGVAP